ncbi:hypothetical protein Dsin_004602 [Dipteronia sinensis]|uniref:Uncharacterized protein n=1 Tax=Dipteronia sinensis TaxID=43782 RepID=A0AAE0EFN9_9ROSI|nr:hypothetical protein Dsin_004602 [Dipteronia sinensis]
MTENENKRVSKDEVISKLKDDGDFDRLRLKIIRKIKDNEELRNSIISVVKQSAALNRAGAENMKPRQLSDAIYEEVGDKVQSQISEGLWAIIKSEDGMKSEIAETVDSVYNKLVNPGGIRVVEPSTQDVAPVNKEADNNGSMKASAGEVDDTVSDNEPKEPPGFYLSHNHNNNSHPSQQQEGMQPMPYVKEPTEEQKEEPQRSQVMLETPGLSTDLQHQQPGDDNDEDPDVPPGFG